MSENERLILLRFIRKLPLLLLVTLIGCLTLGGIYTLKNVILSGPTQYQAKSYFWITYALEYEEEGDYYINDYTWNTYIHSNNFLEKLTEKLADKGNTYDIDRLREMITAYVESDIHLPDIRVISEDPDEAMLIATAAESVMTEYFAGQNEQIEKMRVMDKAVLSRVPSDARPVRAFILAAIVSAFAVSVAFLLWEAGNDGLWLPSTILHEYGIKCVGSDGDPLLSENMKYLFKSEDIEVVNLKDGMPNSSDVFERLRNANGILLEVPAGAYKGRLLQQCLDEFAIQDIKVTAAKLVDADEWLIKAYNYLGRI